MSAAEGQTLTEHDPKDAEAGGTTPDLKALRQKREGEIQRRWVTELINKKRNVSNIELSLTAITVAVTVLKTSLSQLGEQVGSQIGGGTPIEVLDISVAVGFIAIAIATLQIPRQFTETLIYSNQDALRLLALLGASEGFVVMCFRRVILRTMIRAAIMGLGISAIGYLIISPILHLWVPSTLTSFLVDVGATALLITGFIVIVSLLVRLKIKGLFRDYGY
jgi:hypothetical protein